MNSEKKKEESRQVEKCLKGLIQAEEMTRNSLLELDRQEKTIDSVLKKEEKIQINLNKSNSFLRSIERYLPSIMSFNSEKQKVKEQRSNSKKVNNSEKKSEKVSESEIKQETDVFDEISSSLRTLKEMNLEINQSLDRQNKKLEELADKNEKNISNVKSLDLRIRKLL